MSHVWLSVPQERALYVGLPTGYYPWSEVRADLNARPHFSGVLELTQAGHRGRFVWVDGEPRGGYLDGDWPGTPASSLAQSSSEQANPEQTELTLDALCLTCPQAEVSLIPLDAQLASLVWDCRQTESEVLAISWPQAQPHLMAGRLRGALLGAGVSGSVWSFWEGGRMIGGHLPRLGDRLTTVRPTLLASAAALLAFWNSLYQASRLPLAELWTPAASRLANRHPCLDPFARELRLRGGQLELDSDVPPDELLEALSDHFRSMLAISGTALRSLPLGDLRSHPLWARAGLETP